MDPNFMVPILPNRVKEEGGSCLLIRKCTEMMAEVVMYSEAVVFILVDYISCRQCSAIVIVVCVHSDYLLLWYY